MHTSLIHIRSSRLEVEIAQPGTQYRGTRFDWSAFITQVKLDGKHTFCMPESLHPGKGTGGVGLCSEFGNELAVGYDEIGPGELFPKLGVGLLRRPDEGAYNFFRPHEIAELFPIRVDAGVDQANFIVQPLECRGYAARLEKSVGLAENTLIIEYTLENTGSQPIFTHEYCHNFLGIDRQPIGPAYRLLFPQPVNRQPPPPDLDKLAPPGLRWLPKPVLKWLVRSYLSRMGQVMVIKDNEISWTETPKGDFFAPLTGFQPRQEAQWQLVHSPSGVSVQEIDDFSPTRLVVWGTAHVVSAEVYTDINLKPGEIQRWSRRYVFLS